MARTADPSALTAPWDKYFAGQTARRQRRGLPAPQVLVRAPGFEYSSGDREQPFHAASVGKLATSALVLQEVEAGRLALTDAVESLLPADEVGGLFAAPGATAAQLLAHTSGVADYFEGKAASGPPFLDLVTGTPDRRWEPAELLAFSRDHQKPVGDPGQRFVYSDTGFVLLGRILEERTGRGFTELLRERVLVPAGMASSALWLREPGPERIAPARWVISGCSACTRSRIRAPSPQSC